VPSDYGEDAGVLDGVIDIIPLMPLCMEEISCQIFERSQDKLRKMTELSEVSRKL